MLSIIENESSAWTVIAEEGELHVYSREGDGEWSELSLSEESEQVDAEKGTLLEELYKASTDTRDESEDGEPGEDESDEGNEDEEPELSEDEDSGDEEDSGEEDEPEQRERQPRRRRAKAGAKA